MRRAPAVDLVVGPQSYHRLPELMARAQDERKRLVDTDFPEEDKFARLPARDAGTRVHGVPHRAGRLRQVLHLLRRALHARRGVSRAPSPTSSARRDASSTSGVREITLLGQNVNAYHGEGPDGAAVVARAADPRSLARIDGLARLRYTTSHPRDMSDDLIAAHAEEAEADALSAPAGAVRLPIASSPR